VDNITHSLTGLVLSRAGLERLTPRAAWILLLAANAPDIDVVSAFGGSLTYLHYHRHLTHSLVALPVLPLFCVLVVRFVSRKPVNWLGAYVIAFIGVASHLVLDLTNTYGVGCCCRFPGSGSTGTSPMSSISGYGACCSFRLVRRCWRGW